MFEDRLETGEVWSLENRDGEVGDVEELWGLVSGMERGKGGVTFSHPSVVRTTRM